MTSDRLSNYWQQAGQLLGFNVEAPYVMSFPTGESLSFSARLPEFGAEHGMLLSDNYETFAGHEGALRTSGFGYSVLLAPAEAPIAADILELLQDWGWSAPTARPEWLSGA